MSCNELLVQYSLCIIYAFDLKCDQFRNSQTTQAKENINLVALGKRRLRGFVSVAALEARVDQVQVLQVIHHHLTIELRQVS